MVGNPELRCVQNVCFLSILGLLQQDLYDMAKKKQILI